MGSVADKKEILWWGRFDPAYSRNRILRDLLLKNGYTLRDFIPRASWLGTFESRFSQLGRPHAVWVPAFRQRDFHAARRFADKRGTPLIFDPLISAWDKAVFERQKFSQADKNAQKLLRWERSMFQDSDLVLADTTLHAQFFIKTLGARAENTFVVPVGADERVFLPQPEHLPNRPPEILFFGSFIHLQAPEVITDAAPKVPEVQWTMLGDGPLKERCVQRSKQCSNIRFEPWHPYEKLAQRIGQADILLGIFGSSPKAGRVIPNKAYQALACARPLVTRESESYPEILRTRMDTGIYFVPPANANALAQTIKSLIRAPSSLPEIGQYARKSYEQLFSEENINRALRKALARIGL